MFLTVIGAITNLHMMMMMMMMSSGAILTLKKQTQNLPETGSDTGKSHSTHILVLFLGVV